MCRTVRLLLQFAFLQMDRWASLVVVALFKAANAFMRERGKN